MGGRLSCSCPQAYCYGPTPEERILRIQAELFELSADGQKWLMVEPRLLYISCQKSSEGETIVRAASSTGRNLMQTTISKSQRVEKISDCFVFWKESSGRTLAINTLSIKDTMAFITFCSHGEPGDNLMTSMPTMMQHNVMAQVTILASWNGRSIEKKTWHSETTMVSVNPLNMVFHFNHGLVNVDLLECLFCTSTCKSNVLHLAYATHLYSLEFAGEAEKFINQVLYMSSLLLARTTCAEVALLYLKRQQNKLQEKQLMLKYQQGDRENRTLRAKMKLKRFAIEQRLAAIEERAVDKNLVVSTTTSELFAPLRGQLVEDNSLPSIYLIYANMHNFRMWRKPVDVRLNDLKALVTPSSDVIMTCPSSSSDVIIPITLPNGKTTVVSHSNQNVDEVLEKLCQQLSLEPRQFELSKTEGSNNGWKLSLSEEYEVEKRQGKLGLTIYAHNDHGVIRAEVRGVAVYAPGGASIGDSVVSVDGRRIDQVTSAADVEKLLREGKVIRLRRTQKTTTTSEERQEKRVRTPPREVLPVPADVRCKMEEKMVRGIDELLTTERKYVEDLKAMIDRFLSIKTVKEIMESALRLREAQISFLDSLEEAVGDVKVTENQLRPQIRDAVMRVTALFVNKCGDFKVYAEYAAGYLRLQREICLNKELLSQLEAANSSGEQHCSYESRMIRPIQRVVQYPLLLRAIHAGCEKESIEARQVEAAIEKMQTLAEYVNEMQRIHEQFAPLIENIRKEKHSMLQEKGIRIDIRYLVIFAHIRWVNSEKNNSDYVIFVFQSLILLVPAHLKASDCKTKFVKILPINEVEMDENVKRDDCLLVIFHMKQTNSAHITHTAPDAVYQLICCQPQLKQQIMKSIRKARTNFVRETRRPLSGSSQSDGGYGSEPIKDKKK